MTETSRTSALSGDVGYSTCPCNHPNGQALAVIILQLLHTGSPSNAQTAVPTIITGPSPTALPILIENRICASFPLFLPPSPSYAACRRQFQPIAKKTGTKLSYVRLPFSSKG